MTGILDSALALSEHYAIRLNYALLASFAIYVVKNDLDNSCAWYTLGLLMSYMVEASTFNEGYKLFHREFKKSKEINVERSLSDMLAKNLKHVHLVKLFIFIVSNILQITFAILLMYFCETLQYSLGLTLVLLLTCFRSAFVIPVYTLITACADLLDIRHGEQRKHLRCMMEGISVE